jgi:hypothetical protein
MEAASVNLIIIRKAYLKILLNLENKQSEKELIR